ncbi:hypothetical protein [Actinoplanes utahensis]|uniref:hypothetical protein n=1 Tax=Actinoplanes utahensis TaxID=1869 RepID=UPI000A76D211|nr:hypothetical protein [Actinoplanes utahensis]GIF27282.1 hypothetical protein Aut01nite_02680 [Actinoplanes utahensis]
MTNSPVESAGQPEFGRPIDLQDVPHREDDENKTTTDRDRPDDVKTDDGAVPEPAD